MADYTLAEERDQASYSSQRQAPDDRTVTQTSDHRQQGSNV
jgi:hypothetical protein